MTSAVYFGFVAPEPFTPEQTNTVEQHYGARYLAARNATGVAVQNYAAHHRGLRGKQTQAAAYDGLVGAVYAAALRLSVETGGLYERMQSAHVDTPAVEFHWRGVEALLLIVGEGTDAGSVERQFSPPEPLHFASPSIVFEFCAAYTLLASAQLRLLERCWRDSGRLFSEAVEPLCATVQRLARLTRNYVVPPTSELADGGARHPLLASTHFVQSFLAPLLYAQALVLTVPVDLLGTSEKERCVRAAVYAMSGTLLRDFVGGEAPLNVCSRAQHVALKRIAAERRAIAFVNMAHNYYERAKSMSVAAALAESDAQLRAEMFDTAVLFMRVAYHSSYEHARVLPYIEYTLADMHAIGASRVRELSVDDAKPAEHEIVAFIDGKPPAKLSAVRLLNVASGKIHRCAIELVDAEVRVLLQEPGEQGTPREQGDTPRPRRAAPPAPAAE